MLTFGSVIFLLGAFPPFPPLSLQNLQAVVLLQLENGQVELIPEHRAYRDKGKPRQDVSVLLDTLSSLSQHTSWSFCSLKLRRGTDRAGGTCPQDGTVF